MQNNIKNKTNLRSFKMKNRNIGDATENTVKIKLSTQDIFTRIQNLISVKKEISSNNITLESHLKDDLNFYDSLTLIEFFYIMEEEFKIKITDENTENLLQVKHLVERVDNS